MSDEPVGIVTISDPVTRGAPPPETEVRVRTLRDLFEACRDAPPSRVVRVSLKGAEGEVRLNFGSFIRS
jgi:hypothetical protein